MAERNKVIAEGAGACPVAAAMLGLAGPGRRKVVCVVSGGNLDTAKLLQILACCPHATLSPKPDPDARKCPFASRKQKEAGADGAGEGGGVGRMATASFVLGAAVAAGLCLALGRRR